MYYQELYVTDDLQKGEFISHPKSPICKSNEFGRNGGSLIHYDNRLLRVTQDCHSDYGDNVSLMEIDVLSPDDFREHVYRRNVLPANNIFREGGHQLNIVRFKNQYIWYRLWIALLTKLKLHKHRG